MDSIIVNMSMIGKKNTGLGVYSLHVAEQIRKNFLCKFVSSCYENGVDNINNFSSPKNIAIGFSKYASLRRLVYLNSFFPLKKGFLYTPTQHGIIGRKDQIITIHDLIPTYYPKQRKKEYLYYKYILPQIIKNCRGIFTVSNVVKEEICKYYHVSKEFVYVIPNGVETFKYKKSVRSSKDKYLLIVGAAHSYKNAHYLLENYTSWANKYSLKIVSVNGEYRNYLESLIFKYKLENKVELLGYVEEEKLICFYKQCVALVYPSSYEGFGIPPLESLAAGKPVILSDIPVFRETIGDAGIFIDIENPVSWKNAIDLLDNDIYIANKLMLGRDVIERYTWNNSGNILKNALLDIEPSFNKILIERNV